MNKTSFRLGSWSLVAIILGALGLWMASGMLQGDHSASGATEAEPAPLGAEKSAAPAFTVQVREQDAEVVQRIVLANGDTQPDKVINLASQVEGQIVEVGPRKGARVARGALLARVDVRDLESQMIKASAMRHTRELEYGAALKLRETGYVTEGELAAKLAALELARADVKDTELRQHNLVITAPVAAILENRMVEIGDYAKIGQAIAKLIQIDPLIVSAKLNEDDISYVRVGDPASAEVLGQTLQGKVRFVASMSDAATRTFEIQVAVDNPDSRIPAGVSARVSLPVQEVKAQRIPASLLSLADDGAIGVKHVVDGKAVFTPAQIVRSDGDSLYVSGLPDRVQLITRGQGFIKTGETVTVEPEAAIAAPVLAPAAP